ncbi:MAG: DsbA family protein [Candidatus Kerfeldbacteria bacterium]|nr:DsbA family protein [Candidatus Kerfeldbacteria bacterium]
MNDQPWYKRFWVVVGLVVIVCIVAVVVLFIWLVLQEYQKIQRGEISQFANTSTVNSATNLTNVVSGFVPSRDDDPIRGNPKAAVQIISFEDFQCPYCELAAPIMIQLLQNHPTDVAFVYRDFPLDSVHPQAINAALAANCANEQDKFWEYHDLIFSEQSKLALPGIYRTWANQLGLNVTDFTACYESQRYLAEIQQDRDEGILGGVTATPTYFVNGQLVLGVHSVEQWESIVASVVEKTK